MKLTPTEKDVLVYGIGNLTETSDIRGIVQSSAIRSKCEGNPSPNQVKKAIASLTKKGIIVAMSDSYIHLTDLGAKMFYDTKWEIEMYG